MLRLLDLMRHILEIRVDMTSSDSIFCLLQVILKDFGRIKGQMVAVAARAGTHLPSCSSSCKGSLLRD